MEDFVPVQETDGIKQISNDKGGTLLTQSLAIRNEIKELSIASNLHRSIKIFGVMKIAIYFDNIWVFQEALYL